MPWCCGAILLVDGHNRYGICQKHGLPFQTVQKRAFQSMEDVHLWMIDQHLGRRSVSDFQRGVLALRKRRSWQRRARAAAAFVAGNAQAETQPEESSATAAPAAAAWRPKDLSSREAIARGPPEQQPGGHD